MTAPLRIACGSSPEYLPHVAAMVHSVAEHRGGLGLEVHYLHGPDLPRASRRALEEMVDGLGGAARLHEISDRDLEGLPAMPEIPVTMWYRTYLPELLPDVGRLLYLDADVIAVDSLQALWETPLGDDLLGAVTNVWEPWNLGYPESLGLERPYFNSGVLLMDLEGLRTADATARVVAHGRQSGSLPWGDQDALNVVLGSRALALHPRWNCMNSILYLDGAEAVFGKAAAAEARAHPALRHFEGPGANKPWHRRARAADRGLYRRHRSATPWPDYKPAGSPRSVELLRRLLR